MFCFNTNILSVLCFIFAIGFSTSVFPQRDTMRTSEKLNSASFYYTKGDSLEYEYKYFEALQYYKASYEINHNLNALRRIMHCLIKRGQYTEAKQYFTLIPLDSITHSDLRLKFNIYSKTSSRDSLLKIGKEILNRYPYDAGILSNLASFYNEQQIPDSALYYIDKFITTDSTNIFVNRQLAFSFYLKKQYKEALKIYNRLLSLEDLNAQTYYYAGVCYAQLDSLNLAFDMLTIANDKEVANPVILSQLGMTCNKLGFKDDGIKYMQDAISLYMPDKTLLFSLYDTISDAYFSRRKYYDCIENLKKCIELNPSYLYTYYKIARTYGLAKNLKNEKKYYTEFLKKAKESNEINKTMNLFINEAERRLRCIKEDDFFKKGIPNEKRL